MRRQHSSKGVELNVTAMLDMAFQLLAFFVLTFRQEPTEPAVLLQMPPAQTAVAEPTKDPRGRTPDITHFTPAGANTLRIDLLSTNGDLDRITIDDLPAETFEILRDNMRQRLTDPGTLIEQVVVRASAGLRYDEVMKVIAICSEQKLPTTGDYVKLSLIAR